MKFDELIEGFADMTAEEKLSAIEGFDYKPKTDDGEINRLKNLLSKANTEAAENKRKLNERMSEEEKAKEAQVEKEKHFAEVENELNLLKRSSALIKIGYTEENAMAIATALNEGNTDRMFEILAKHNAEQKDSIIAELSRSTKRPEKDYGQTDSGLSSDEKLAEQLGKERAEASKTATDALSNFMHK